MPVDPYGIGDVDAPCPVDPELAEKLVGLGFDPSAPVYRATPIDSYDRAFREIIDGFYGKGFVQGDGVHCEEVDLAFSRRNRRYAPYMVTMMLELIQAIYRPGAVDADPHQPTQLYLERFRAPDWYVRGIVRSPCLPDDPGPSRFHGYIQTEPDEQEPTWPHGMVIQITKVTGASSGSASLSWGVGLPTDPLITTA